MEGGRLLYAAGVCWELKKKKKKKEGKTAVSADRRSATFPEKEYKIVRKKNASFRDLDAGGGFAGRKISTINACTVHAEAAVGQTGGRSQRSGTALKK